MVARGEGCKLKLYKTDSHFIRIPEKWVEKVTIKKKDVAVTKLNVNNSVYFLTVGGTSHLQDTVEVGPILGIPITTTTIAYIDKPEEHSLGLAERITVAPVSQADWDIIRFNQGETEHTILTKVRSIQKDSIISIFINSLKLRLKVTDVVPNKECVILQEMTEMEIIPMNSSDDEFEFLSSDEDNSVTENIDNENVKAANKSTFSTFFNFLQPENKSEEDKLLLDYFLQKPLKEVVTIVKDDSITLPTICKIPAGLILHPHKSFFAKIIFRLQAKDDKKDYGSVLVKCIIDSKLTDDRIHVSPTLTSWKDLQMNEKVLLESLPYNLTNTDIVSVIELCEEKEESGEILQSMLVSDFNIFEKNCPITINDHKGIIQFKSSMKIAITRRNCEVKLVSPSQKEIMITNDNKTNLNNISIGPNAKIYEKEFELCYNFCVTSLMTNRKLKPYHCLITGLPGIGKTTFCLQLAEKLKENDNVNNACINCSLLKGKRADVIKKKIMEELKQLSKLRPSILILENLEVVFGEKDDEQSDDNSTTLALWLSDTLKHITQTMDGIMVLATSESLEILNSNLQTLNGNPAFETIIKLSPPDKSDKAKLIQHYLNHIPDQLKTLELDEFLPCDIKLICDRIKAFKAYDSPGNVVDSFTPVSYWGKSLKPQLKRDLEQVGGIFEAKDILMKTIIWQIQYQEIFQSVGVRMPKGVLLYGAPGTGKTLLAEALASSHQINFIPVKGPELLSKYIGASERNVRDLFIKAQNAKPCIIFFDEFDSLAPKRGHDSTGVTDRVVNQLLTQMDGVEGLDGVWILATTSRPDLIDGALLRPGRIDKSVLCPIPSFEDRVDILGRLVKDYNLSDNDVNIKEIAVNTVGYTGADLKAVLYNSKQLAKKDDRDNDSFIDARGPMIRQKDLLQAVDQTKPSVSQQEINRLTAIYSRFKSGKLVPEVSQRATLA